MKEFEDYCYENTNVLINKFDIRDSEELRLKENELLETKLVFLYLNPDKNINIFDKNSLITLHKFLFEDIYDFAGTFRNVDIKKVWQWDYFTPYKDIETELDKVFEKYNNDKYNIQSERSYCSFLANFYKELIRIHPFREGNGRTIREFMRQFVDENNKNLSFANYELDYSLMDRNNFNEGIKNNLIGNGLLEVEFYKALKKVDIDTKDNKRK